MATSKVLKPRRGSTTEHANFRGQAYEITFDTDKKTIVAHDGLTIGGFPLAHEAAIVETAEALTALIEEKASEAVSSIELQALDTALRALIAQKLDLGGGTLTNNLYITGDSFCGVWGRANSNDCYFGYVENFNPREASQRGAFLRTRSGHANYLGGSFELIANDATNGEAVLRGRPDNKKLTWLGNDILTTGDSAKIAGYAMPSSLYVDLTLGASGTTYIAPADGYLYVNKKSSAAGQYFWVDNTTKNIVQSYVTVGTADNCLILFPVSKGDVMRVLYTAAGVTHAFRFIYAEGAK